MDSYGILSLLPPLLAVIIAIRTKNVITALFWSGLLGVFVLAGGNPITAVPMYIKDYIFVQAADGYNSSLLVMMIFIGGFVGVVTESGGASAFANRVAPINNTRCKAQLAVWFMGLLIFFSDSGNPLIIGPAFQPITDRIKVSREKLAWLLDATASPVCILIPFIGWGIFIMGLMQKEFDALHLGYTDFETFVRVIPFQFYAIGTLFMIPIVALTGREFGAMFRAEKRAIELNQPYAPGSQTARTTIDTQDVHPGATYNMMLLPLIVLFVTIFGLLIPQGFPLQPVKGAVLRSALCTGYLLGAFVCMLLMVKNKVATFKESFGMYMNGAKSVTFILMILVLAWVLGSVCKALGTANFIVELARGNIPTFAVPLLLFFVGMCISFATGSSWGTFAILIPLAIPMSVKLGAPLYASIGAVLSGGLFGDHCSPISDTTVLSAIGAACDLIDHVKTQLPYALMVCVVCSVGYLLAGIYETPLLLFGVLAGVLVMILGCSMIWGKRLSDEPDEAAAPADVAEN